MIGSILKYTAVMAVGAVGFATAAHFMDNDIIDKIKEEIEIHKATMVDLGEIEFKEKMVQYVQIRREEWFSRLTFATSVKELANVLTSWS